MIAKFLGVLLLPMVITKNYLTQSIYRLRLAQTKSAYKARKDDLFLVTYPKSGTTWLQMIIHQLTSDGAMDLSHINEVSPHLEEEITGQGVPIESMPSPRIFKTHLSYQHTPKGSGKYIYMARDGRDVAVSYYYHFRRYYQFQGSFAEFFPLFMAGRIPYGNWFNHMQTWLENKQGLDILLLKYEDLIEDLGAGMDKIVTFLNLDISDEHFQRAVAQSSFAFMKQHETVFDLDNRGKRNKDQISFIRKGESHQWEAYLEEPQLAHYHQLFGRHPLISSRAGYSS